MAFARVYVGAHWPGDVAVGAGPRRHHRRGRIPALPPGPGLGGHRAGPHPAAAPAHRGVARPTEPSRRRHGRGRGCAAARQVPVTRPLPGIFGARAQQAHASAPSEVVLASPTVIDPLVAAGIGAVVLGEAAGAAPAVGALLVCAACAGGGVIGLARTTPRPHRRPPQSGTTPPSGSAHDRPDTHRTATARTGPARGGLDPPGGRAGGPGAARRAPARIPPRPHQQRHRHPSRCRPDGMDTAAARARPRTLPTPADPQRPGRYLAGRHHAHRRGRVGARAHPARPHRPRRPQSRPHPRRRERREWCTAGAPGRAARRRCPRGADPSRPATAGRRKRRGHAG
jgi:hypothetical protein